MTRKQALQKFLKEAKAAPELHEFADLVHKAGFEFALELLRDGHVYRDPGLILRSLAQLAEALERYK